VNGESASTAGSTASGRRGDIVQQRQAAAGVGRVAHAFDIEDNRFGVQRRAILELDAGSQLDAVVPAFVQCLETLGIRIL
jgi:hypothetical protein